MAGSYDIFTLYPTLHDPIVPELFILPGTPLKFRENHSPSRHAKSKVIKVIDVIDVMDDLTTTKKTFHLFIPSLFPSSFLFETSAADAAVTLPSSSFCDHSPEALLLPRSIPKTSWFSVPPVAWSYQSIHHLGRFVLLTSTIMYLSLIYLYTYIVNTAGKDIISDVLNGFVCKSVPQNPMRCQCSHPSHGKASKIPPVVISPIAGNSPSSSMTFPARNLHLYYIHTYIHAYIYRIHKYILYIIIYIHIYIDT